MKTVWQTYWKENLRRARSMVLAMGVAFLFWLFSLPGRHTEQYAHGLVVSLMYGACVFALLWVLFSVFHAGLVWRGKPAEHVPWKVSLPISFIATALGLALAQGLESIFFGKEFRISTLFERTLIGGFIALMFMFSFAYRSSREENLALRASKAESELNVLKNQLQPHFLFNSLNSLSELIDSNRDDASEMAMRLSDLYREILENSKTPMSLLESEISIVKKYLDLEKIRWGDRLRFDVLLPLETSGVYLPSLMLQTLVENAVKHGVGPSVTGGRVVVEVRPSDQKGFEVKVTNTGRSAAKPNSKGTGLANTLNRLDLFYGERHRFQLSQRESETVASFWVSGEKR